MSDANKSCGTCHGASTPLNEVPEGFAWAGPIAKCPECRGWDFYIGATPEWYKPLLEYIVKEREAAEKEEIKKRISDPSRLP